MLILPIFAAVIASFGWATGIVLAQSPAQKLGAFEFTRIQLIACSAILCDNLYRDGVLAKYCVGILAILCGKHLFWHCFRQSCDD